MVLPPAQVRALASAPGTTLTRLLVDPADGRCLERSIATYRPDAAMRAQLLAADVTCRAPACHHPGRSCQVDHVVEHGSPGGVTSEANAQLVHAGHHESKTAKDWDAKLSANRDVRWTTLLGRVYRTRAWDYRRYVTLVVGAMEAVRSAPAGERAVELDRQIYLALAHRELGERLNVGDDDLDPDICRFEGWPAVRLTHRDPATGERVPGPSPAAVTDTIVARATSNPVAAHPHAVIEPGAHPAPRPPTAADLDGRTSTRDRTRRRTPDRSSVQRAWTLADEEGIVPF